MDMIPWYLPILFFLVAVVYSTVGFAGGSSYLALLVVCGFTYSFIPPLALVCNIVVASCAFWYFFRCGHFRFKTILPFIMLSIPMAYWGGRIFLPKKIFCLLLSFSLFVAALRLLAPKISESKVRTVSLKMRWTVGLPLGATLGFLSGLIGIGGGIFLSPILLFLRWVSVKEAAACASFFILVNSISGLAGQIHKGFSLSVLAMPLVIGVFLGGQLGARLGSQWLPKKYLIKILALLLLYASVNLMVKAI
jgi:uncharacterized membrane protein YfcA